MEIEKKPSTNEETYRIYNYFKEHPGILLSAVSVLTAVLAVVANALAFLYQYIKFQKWNINILKWGLPFKGNTIYYPALSLLYILLVFCLCYVMLQIFEVAFSSYALHDTAGTPKKFWTVWQEQDTDFLKDALAWHIHDRIPT